MRRKKIAKTLYSFILGFLCLGIILPIQTLALEYPQSILSPNQQLEKVEEPLTQIDINEIDPVKTLSVPKITPLSPSANYLTPIITALKISPIKITPPHTVIKNNRTPIKPLVNPKKSYQILSYSAVNYNGNNIEAALRRVAPKITAEMDHDTVLQHFYSKAVTAKEKSAAAKRLYINKLQGAIFENEVAKEYGFKLSEKFNQKGWDVKTGSGPLKTVYQIKCVEKFSDSQLKTWLEKAAKEGKVDLKRAKLIIPKDTWENMKAAGKITDAMEKAEKNGNLLISGISRSPIRDFLKTKVSIAKSIAPYKYVNNTLKKAKLSKTKTWLKKVFGKGTVTKWIKSFSPKLVKGIRVGGGLMGILAVVLGAMEAGGAIKAIFTQIKNKQLSSKDLAMDFCKLMAGVTGAISGAVGAGALLISATGIGAPPGAAAGAIAAGLGVISILYNIAGWMIEKGWFNFFFDKLDILLLWLIKEMKKGTNALIALKNKLENILNKKSLLSFLGLFVAVGGAGKKVEKKIQKAVQKYKIIKVKVWRTVKKIKYASIKVWRTGTKTIKKMFWKTKTEKYRYVHWKKGKKGKKIKVWRTGQRNVKIKVWRKVQETYKYAVHKTKKVVTMVKKMFWKTKLIKN